MALKGRAGHKHKIIMVNLTKAQMSSVSCGITKEQCENSAKVRYILTGVFTIVTAIPVAGWLMGGPSAVALYAIDGLCIWAAE